MAVKLALPCCFRVVSTTTVDAQRIMITRKIKCSQKNTRATGYTTALDQAASAKHEMIVEINYAFDDHACPMRLRRRRRRRRQLDNLILDARLQPLGCFDQSLKHVLSELTQQSFHQLDDWL